MRPTLLCALAVLCLLVVVEGSRGHGKRRSGYNRKSSRKDIMRGLATNKHTSIKKTTDMEMKVKQREKKTKSHGKRRSGYNRKSSRKDIMRSPATNKHTSIKKTTDMEMKVKQREKKTKSHGKRRSGYNRKSSRKDITRGPATNKHASTKKTTDMEMKVKQREKKTKSHGKRRSGYNRKSSRKDIRRGPATNKHTFTKKTTDMEMKVKQREKKTKSARFLYTHAETCYPFTSGLLKDVHTLVTTRNTTSSRFSRRQNSDLQDFGDGWKDECNRPWNILFRTPDGSCNNGEVRGMSMTPLARLLPAHYSDGLRSPRQFSVTSVTTELPSARTVSRTVHPDKIDTSDLTIYVMQWGQFMDHEMVSTPLPVEDTARGIIQLQCCGDNNGLATSLESSECFPILFPLGDPKFNSTCMEFLRSQPVKDSNGSMILPRENENVVTAYIDGSTVYGSTKEVLEELRDEEYRHLLRTTDDNFPPDNGLNDCVKRDENDICFLAGDERVNEQPALTLMHVIFVRYHNYVASQLRERKPYDSGEFIFQQARAIVTAVIQKILYVDWLPIVLGPSVRAEFDLDTDPKVRTVHDSNVDPTILQAFSTAAFRFGHTLIPRSLPLVPRRSVLLRELFFKPFEARKNLDTLVEGLAWATVDEDRSQPPDQFFVEEVTCHLFENQQGEGQGFDLVSLNIQRGRDHGIPGYNAFRHVLDLPKVMSFNDAALGTSGTSLSMVYDDVDDIDLFAGGMSESYFDGGLVGKTFSRLIATQMKRLKFGDRFFFNNQRNRFGFTDLQLKLIHKISLSDILCITTRILEVQPDVFRVPGPGNARRRCDKIRREHPNLSAFSEYPF